jgi:hypothetical protein
MEVRRIGPEKLHRGPDGLRRRAMFNRAEQERERSKFKEFVSTSKRELMNWCKMSKEKRTKDEDEILKLLGSIEEQLNAHRDSKNPNISKLRDAFYDTVNGYNKELEALKIRWQGLYDEFVKRFRGDKAQIEEILNDKFATYNEKVEKVKEIRAGQQEPVEIFFSEAKSSNDEYKQRSRDILDHLQSFQLNQEAGPSSGGNE